MVIAFKCRKCRSPLLSYPNNRLINAHGHEIQLRFKNNSPKLEFIDTVEQNLDRGPASLLCSSLHEEQDVIYIDEVTVPEWVTLCIDKGDWTKGKLLCPFCSARVGSFDFVSGFHCQCQSSVVPAIHFVRSKIDYNATNILQPDARYAN